MRPEERAEAILGNESDGPMSELLHTLWTKAVGTPDYVKTEWQALEIVLYRMRRKIHDEVKSALASSKGAPGSLPLRDASGKVRDFSGGGLTFDELVAALRNLGFDLTCGHCASVFYTGSALEPHDDSCQTRK